jgi:hypothetical protein
MRLLHTDLCVQYSANPCRYWQNVDSLALQLSLILQQIESE